MALGKEIVSTLSSSVIVSKIQAHDSSLARVVKSRISIAEEIPNSRRLNTATLKSLSGDEPVTVRNLYQDMREEVCQATIHIPTNSHPNESDAIADPAWRRRLIIMPWEYIIPEEERNANIWVKFKEEEDIILQWVLLGWEMYKDNNNKIEIKDYMKATPDEGDKEFSAYDMDALKEMMSSKPPYITVPDLYSIMGIEGNTNYIGRKVKKLMSSFGYKKIKKRIKGSTVWCYELTYEDDEDYE